MPQTSQTFRIFVSSTFSDLEAERNALQSEVFHHLRELCQQHGARFQAIDLRWGVSEEASHDQRAMKICLGEIERCRRVTPRPNFIILLGDRYGWRPLPAEIPAVEFQEIEQRIPHADDRWLLNQWYRRDDNAAPPVYCLQPRTAEFIDYKVWEEQVERPLRSVLLHATAGMQLTSQQRLKYEASATEQEIRHRLTGVPEGVDDVFCFFRSIQDLPVAESARDFLDLDQKGELDSEARLRLDSLKGELHRLLPGNAYDYQAQWTGRGITAQHLPQFCQDVFHCLSRIIKEEMGQFEEVDVLDKEIAAHDTFGEERAKFFIGRANSLQAIGDYLNGADCYPLGLFGPSGVGKSALMARVIETCRREHPDANVVARFIGATPESSQLIPLLRGLCEQIYRALDYEQQKQQRIAEVRDDATNPEDKRLEIQAEYNIPGDFNGLSRRFQEFSTEKVPAGKRLIVVLDALDQLTGIDDAWGLHWLPTSLPENVRLVVSTSPGPCLSALKERYPSDCLVEMALMPRDQGGELLDVWLQDAGRALQEFQRQEVLNKFAGCGLPLYLKLAFEEARQWTSYTEPERTALGVDILGLIRDLYGRLSSDANHGVLLVSRSLSYLATARNGLSEDELLDVLSLDAEVFQDFMARAFHEPPEQRLPVVVWSRLYFDLEPYLAERSADGATLLSFYHRQLSDVVADAYLAGEARGHHHRHLADYFRGQVLQIEKEGGKRPNMRKIAEQPYQLTRAGMWEELEQTLCDLRFMEAKCAGGMTYALLSDYQDALACLPEGQEHRDNEQRRDARNTQYGEALIAYARQWNDIRDQHALDPHRHPLPGPAHIPCPAPPASVVILTENEIKDHTAALMGNPTRYDHIGMFAHFAGSEADGLTRYGSIPGYCIQQAHNSASEGPVYAQASRITQQEGLGYAFLRRPELSSIFNPHPACLQKWTGNFYHVAITYDGKQALSGHYDGTLWLWDALTGRNLTILSGSDGNAGAVNALTLSPDGRTAVVARAEGVLQVWDVRARRCINTVPTDQQWVNALNMTPDGRLAVSAGADATVCLWDLATGACLQTLLGHEGRVTAVAMTPDGRLAVSAGADATVCLWDLATGACLQTLSGHQQEVKALAMTPDGRRAVSGGQDAVLRVWDLGAGGCLHALQGHTEYISVVDLTPDGQKAVSGGYDASIRIWDLERGRCLKVFHGHTDTVISLSLTPDGARAISATAADDPTIRLWDIETGQSEPTPHHYHGNVWSVALSPEGSIAVSVDDCLRVWDASTGQSLQILETSLGIHPDSTVALTPDGRLIVFADERNIRLWDLSTGQCIRTLPGEGGRIRSLTLTPDGRWAITAEEARENLLSLWDLASGTRVKAVNCPDESIVGLWVSPDGRLVISKSQRQRYRVWDIQSGQWVKTYEAAQENGAPIDGAELRILLEHRGKMETLHQGPVKEPVTLPDRRLGLLNDDQALRMLNMETGQCVAAVDLLSTVFSFATNGNVVVVGDRFGAVHFFRILNRAGYIPRTTVLRLYLFGKSGWDAHLRSICPWCCQRFVPEAGKLETIRCITTRLSSGQSPLLALTGDVFDEPGLLSSCPHCHASLRFNPFIVDNSSLTFSTG